MNTNKLAFALAFVIASSPARASTINSLDEIKLSYLSNLSEQISLNESLACVFSYHSTLEKMSTRLTLGQLTDLETLRISQYFNGIESTEFFVQSLDRGNTSLQDKIFASLDGVNWSSQSNSKFSDPADFNLSCLNNSSSNKAKYYSSDESVAIAKAIALYEVTYGGGYFSKYSSYNFNNGQPANLFRENPDSIVYTKKGYASPSYIFGKIDGSQIGSFKNIPNNSLGRNGQRDPKVDGKGKTAKTEAEVIAQAVPELSEKSMMIAGLGLIGYATRRRMNEKKVKVHI